MSATLPITKVVMIKVMIRMIRMVMIMMITIKMAMRMMIMRCGSNGSLMSANSTGEKTMMIIVNHDNSYHDDQHPDQHQDDHDEDRDDQ